MKIDPIISVPEYGGGVEITSGINVVRTGNVVSIYVDGFPTPVGINVAGTLPEEFRPRQRALNLLMDGTNPMGEAHAGADGTLYIVNRSNTQKTAYGTLTYVI